MPNLVELYTFDGPVYVDTRELDSGITNLKAYTCEGIWCSDARVHREKLFASQDLAEQNYNRILVDLCNRSRRQTDRVQPDVNLMAKIREESLFRALH